MKIKVGFGFDVHQLLEGKDFWLGGIKLEHTKGAVGHSDADVLIHAIIDALLGAAGLGDIGQHFPDTDKTFKDINSRKLLRTVVETLKSNNYIIGNIDATIICEAPKMKSYINQMVTNISDDCMCDLKDINIKATTTEKLGFVGRSEGIAAQCSCLIESF